MTSISMAEFVGVGGISIKNQVLDDQADANEKAGRALAVANNPIGEVRITLPTNYSGAFDIVPSIGWYTWGIPNASLKRQLALNGKKLVCRQVENRIDVRAGTIQTSVILEVEAIGADGIPGNYPTSYPAPANPPDPTWNEPAGASEYSFVITAYDSDNSVGQATAATLSAGVFTLGAPTTFDNGFQFGATSVASLSPVQALVCFRASSNGNAQVLDISGTTITPGTLEVFNTGLPTYLEAVALSSSQALVVYSDTNDSTLKACILDVSGSTVTAGVEAAILAESTSYVSVARLSATKAIAAFVYTGAGTRTNLAVLDISGSTVTPGTPFDIGEDISEAAIVALDATTALVFYKDSSDDLRTVDITGITTTGSVGTPETIVTGSVFPGVAGRPWARAIDSTHAVCVFSEGTDIKAVAVEYAAGTITAGSVVALTSSGTNSFPAVALVNSTGTLAAVAHNTFSNGQVRTIGISGTTVTDNSDPQAFDSDAVEYVSITELKAVA